MTGLRETRKQMLLMYGKNERIEGAFDGEAAAVCHNGTFVGEKNGAVISYKGIPFAMPPVGERRWKAPEDAPTDYAVYEAKYFGPSPIQTQIASERASLYVQSEDCLYLNVYKNRYNTSEKKPVLVFIHGGSYGWGGTSDPLYDGSNFVTKFDDIIMVTIAYRTGIMGFMDFSFVPGGEAFADSGNLGLLDQICALRWVRRNIAAFGGDPERVTVAGESAGGGSVSLLPLIPEARGLFKRVIAESGSIALTYSREEVHDLTVNLMKAAGTRDMKGLMALSEDRLMELNAPLNESNNFPLRDGRILPEDLYGAYERGIGCDIDLLIGTNADEARYWIGEVGGYSLYKIEIPILFEMNMKRVSKADKDRVDKFMSQRQDETHWKITEFYNEIMFRLPALHQALCHSNKGGRAFVYYWNYPSAIKHMGACHAVELAYVYNNLTQTIYTGDNINIELADETSNMWANFIRTGDPSTKKNNWPAYSAESRQSMILGSHIRPVNDLLSEQKELLDPLLKYRFNGCYAHLDLTVPQAVRIKKWIINAVIFLLIIAALIILLLCCK